MKIESAIQNAVTRAVKNEEQNHDVKENIRKALHGLSSRQCIDILIMMTAEYRWRSQFDAEDVKR